MIARGNYSAILLLIGSLCPIWTVRTVRDGILLIHSLAMFLSVVTLFNFKRNVIFNNVI